MKLGDVVDIDKFIQLIDDGFINIQIHPTLDLAVYKYSKDAPYHFKAEHWPDELKIARGLVCNSNFEIIARPIGKFFNYGEVPLQDFFYDKKPIITNKVDGSCILVSHYNNDIVINTLGSFTSEQALWAQEIWNKKHQEAEWPDNITLIFEAVYDQNRIVVNYDFEDLVYLTAIDNITGADIDLHWTGRCVDQYNDIEDLDTAHNVANSYYFEDQEGLVLCWRNFRKPSYRLKMKHANYVFLHGVVTKTSTTSVWEHLSTGGKLDDLLSIAPDELGSWIKFTARELESKFDKILATAFENYFTVRNILLNRGIEREAPDFRKEFALLANKMEYRGILFMLLDDKELKQISDFVWKTIKPKYEAAHRLIDADE